MGRHTSAVLMGALALGVGMGILAVPGGDAEAVVPTFFRKCEFKLMVAGRGLPRTEVPGSRFSAWARTTLRSRASRRLNANAKRCAEVMVQHNLPAPPTYCRDNAAVHTDRQGDGVSGFRLTRAKDAIKKTICSLPHRRVDGHDTRTYQGFRVYLRKVSGNGSCPNRNIIEPRELTIKCRSFLKDSDTLWNYMPKK